MSTASQSKECLLTMLFKFDCDALPGCPFVALLDPTCGSFGLCWEGAMFELVMPFVAGRGTVEVLPVGCPDMIVDSRYLNGRPFDSTT